VEGAVDRASVAAVASASPAVAGAAAAELRPADAGGARMKCAVCMDKVPSDNILISPCSHICCSECWKQSLDRKLECPVCRKFTRLQFLHRICLND
jgi:hypothetical protein